MTDQPAAFYQFSAYVERLRDGWPVVLTERVTVSQGGSYVVNRKSQTLTMPWYRVAVDGRETLVTSNVATALIVGMSTADSLSRGEG